MSATLDAKVALVTGAASPLGESTAAALAEAGATVEARDLDVADREAVERAVDETHAAHGRLDVLCNLAELPSDGTRVLDLDEKAFDRVFAVNFKGVLHACRAALRVMMPGDGGAIVNISALETDLPTPGSAAYAVSKTSVAVLTRILAREVGRKGIRVNTVAPGLLPPEAGGDVEASLIATSAMRRPGAPHEVAALVRFLASAEASFITGQTIRASGGASMPW